MVLIQQELDCEIWERGFCWAVRKSFGFLRGVLILRDQSSNTCHVVHFDPNNLSLLFVKDVVEGTDVITAWTDSNILEDVSCNLVSVQPHEVEDVESSVLVVDCMAQLVHDLSVLGQENHRSILSHIRAIVLPSKLVSFTRKKEMRRKQNTPL